MPVPPWLPFPRELPALTAGLSHQTYVHWPYPPDVVRPLLPSGLRPDESDGRAWVSLVALVMRSVHPLGLVPLPRGTFAQTNLRTYVRTRDGRSGVWFLSLDAGHPLMPAARAFGIPYHWSDLTVRRSPDGRTLTYTGRRRAGRGRNRPAAPPGYRLTVRAGAPARTPPDLDRWLTARWSSFSHRAGVLWETRIEHPPWRLRGAEVLELRETLTANAGLPAPGAPALAHLAEPMERVRLGVARPVGRG
ncbi:DUF2071 domain-containing protein [Streptomyces sp. HNM0645]|uniref:YqjF family protein n=1 Tax=Streptomyces sp. HNM0645 TaxID=2782343 RepID=UPI0024B6644C|nr:DUF2071 domain-containing protein [Streptomyces sp. HNM0645]MDI9887164.1 DUF2071 domain-containing protein [Streptomyces sp. HNM0645]